MADPSIPQKEFASRRKKLMQKLKKSVGVLYAGNHDPEGSPHYRPHPHFEYLTGITDEPGAILVLDPASPIDSRKELLFLPPIDPEMDKWTGYRLEISAKLREKTGINAIFREYHFGRFLLEAVKRSRSLACLHPLAQHNQPVSPDLELFQKIAARVPGTSIVDHTEEVAKMRAIKSTKEVAMMQKAIDITAIGFETVIRAIKPGMNEFDVQETLEHTYRSNGGRFTAFNTIAGAGLNTTVLHYEDNCGPVEDGDLVLIDSGTTFGGYAADITRTVPANGKFTKRQKEIYNIVLKAEEAAIRATKPGVRIAELDQISRAIITKAGYGDYFNHSIGHHLGLETHDITPDEPLKVGAVITIEPGIYIADEKIGVRIEDDVVVTKDGCRNLSRKIPKSVAAIEKLMAKK